MLETGGGKGGQLVDLDDKKQGLESSIGTKCGSYGGANMRVSGSGGEWQHHL